MKKEHHPLNVARSRHGGTASSGIAPVSEHLAHHSALKHSMCFVEIIWFSREIDHISRVGLSRRLTFALDHHKGPPSPGGLEPLGKRRKELGRSQRPARAERAGASESLGRGEGGRTPISPLGSPVKVCQRGDTSDFHASAFPPFLELFGDFWSYLESIFFSKTTCQSHETRLSAPKRSGGGNTLPSLSQFCGFLRSIFFSPPTAQKQATACAPLLHSSFFILPSPEELDCLFPKEAHICCQ